MVNAPGAASWQFVAVPTQLHVGVGRHCDGTAAQLPDDPLRLMMIKQYWAFTRQ